MTFYAWLPISLPWMGGLCVLRWVLVIWLLCATTLGLAQTAPITDMGKVEITSGRDNDTQQRRESTA